MCGLLRASACAMVMLATPVGAIAADVAPVPAPVASPVWSWTGLYAGIHLASGWALDNWQRQTGLPSFTPFPVAGAGVFAVPLLAFPGAGVGNGAVGGGQVGLNYQTGPWVFGAEVAFGFADINTITSCGQGLFTCTVNVDALGTATGRLGFAFDQFLIYAKGGAAAAHVHDQMVLLSGITNNTFTGSATRWGWTAGGGLEFAFNPALSAFAEYDFLDLGSRGVGLVDQNGNPASVAVSEHVHLVKLGLNYKLGQALSPWAMTASALPAFPVPPPASWNWAGFYVGGHVGGGWGQTSWNSASPLFASGVFAGSGTDNGFAIGGQLGYNYQIGPWVMGFETDADWSDLDGYAKCATSPATGSSFTCHTHINGVGTLTGRLGQSFGNLLVYGKGGAAWDDEDHVAINRTNSRLAGTDTRWGWTVGAGLEYAFTPAWSGKVEYDYLSFANTSIAMNDGAGNGSSVGMSQNINIVKMGFNYKLGADPTASPYLAAPAPIWVKAPVFKAPPPSDWTIEAGARYWVSTGRKQQDLYDPNITTQINSRLFFEGGTGQAAESFARLDHRDGMFLKGNLGLGDLGRGQFYDEDFPPGTEPYSITLSKQGDGRTLYGGLDVGHIIFAGPGGDVGAYAGYRYLYERENAYGIAQLAASGIGAGAAAPPSSLLVISETEAWSGVAVGVNSRVQLADRWRLELDAALLPYLGLWGVDNHWQRAGINPGPEQGQSWGSQFEAIVTYMLTDQWSVGAGGRYWYFASTTGHTQFPTSVTNSPMKFYSERYGGFLQATYKFGGPSIGTAVALYKAPPAPVSWTGFYVGGHLGAGFGRSTWSDPFPQNVLGGIGDRIPMGGGLAGGQIGTNYQVGALVYGLQAAGSWTQIEGTYTCFAGNPNLAVGAQGCGTKAGPLGTVTGRIGYAAGRTLYFADAGLGWGHSTFQLNFAGAAPGQLAVANADRWGWTIGGGIEQALTREWSIVGEYKYVDLGSATISFAGVPLALAQVATEAINQRYHLLMLGLNYKLN
jgi:opacity protein-like surface antigen